MSSSQATHVFGHSSAPWARVVAKKAGLKFVSLHNARVSDAVATAQQLIGLASESTSSPYYSPLAKAIADLEQTADDEDKIAEGAYSQLKPAEYVDAVKAVLANPTNVDLKKTDPVDLEKPVAEWKPLGVSTLSVGVDAWVEEDKVAALKQLAPKVMVFGGAASADVANEKKFVDATVDAKFVCDGAKCVAKPVGPNDFVLAPVAFDDDYEKVPVAVDALEKLLNPATDRAAIVDQP